MTNNYLIHHGRKGQEWGVRNGPPYPLDPKSVKKAIKKDTKWLKKKESKIYKKAYKESEKEIKEYATLLGQKFQLKTNGQVSKSYINALNQGMAELMNEKVSDLTAPAGHVVRFVAKRGSLGVYTALADAGYDMSQVSKGVWDSGRIAYKKKSVEVTHSDIIEHHGIKGQKWGVRNGPPYPIEESTKRIYGHSGKSYNDILKDSSMIAKINPNSGEIERNNNCVHCCLAYELNTLFGMNKEAAPYYGFDEIAGGFNPEGRSIEVYNQLFDGLKRTDYQTSYTMDVSEYPRLSDIRDQIPNGSVGIIGLYTPEDTDHVVNYEKSSDGSITFIDTQINKIYDDNELRFADPFRIYEFIDFSNATIKIGNDHLFGQMTRDI